LKKLLIAVIARLLLSKKLVFPYNTEYFEAVMSTTEAIMEKAYGDKKMHSDENLNRSPKNINL
jgi:hypothetical protein